MDLARSRFNERGFGLLEVTISVGLLTTVSLSVAQLFAVAVVANLNAKSQTSTALLATQKMEQFRGLTWGFDQTSALGLPVSDTTTNLSTDPSSPGGQGLNPSPASTLGTNTPGYVDYIDAEGKWVGNDSSPAPNTYHIRRWSVQPLPTNPNNTVILQVLVTTLRQELRRTGSGPREPLPDDIWLVSVKTRKAP